MVIKVKVNIFRKVMTRKSKLRKLERELKLGGKPTTEGQQQWNHPVKTKIDGK